MHVQIAVGFLAVICTGVLGSTFVVPPLLSTPATHILNCSDSRLDIVFVLDSSGSVGIDNFTLTKDFVKSIVQELTIGPDKAQVGVITFSKYPYIRFGLDEFHDKDAILKGIDSVPYIAGITETQSALYLLQNEGFQGARPDSTHIAVVITDGKSFHTDQTEAAALSAQQKGIVMFAIGIGGDINLKELFSIATDPNVDHVYTVTNFASLKNFANSLTFKICAATPGQIMTLTSPLPSVFPTSTPVLINPSGNGTQEECNRTVADIVFVLDSSGSLGVLNFMAVKNFVIDIINYLDIGPEYTKVGIITFSNYPTLRVKLDTYTNKYDLINAVNQIPYYPGNTETDKALDLLRLEGFQGERKDAPDIAIVITDGLSTNPELTRIAASQLKKAYATVFAVGIGSDIDTTELSAISSDPDQNYMFFASNFSDLSKIENSLAKTTCEVQLVSTTINTVPPSPSTTVMVIPSTMQPKPTLGPSALPLSTNPPCNSTAADVVFVVDTSGSVGEANFRMVKEFIKQTIKVFDLGSDYTRVGVITFSTLAKLEFELDEYNTTAALNAAIDNIVYSQGGTNTGAALELLRLHGFTNERPENPNIAIVITDGFSKDEVATKQQAKLARQDSNITIIAIGIGNGTDYTELTDIATFDARNNQSLVFEVGGFEALQTLQNVVATVSCGFVVQHPTLPSVTEQTTSQLIDANCSDTLPNCPEYGQDICYDYKPWALAHCSLSCGFCKGPVTTPEPCENNIENCQEYGTYICTTVSLISWTKSNCPKYCGFCGGGLIPTEPPTTTVVTTKAPACENTITNCKEYGGENMCQNPAYEGWARAHCAEYCGFCSKYTQYKGQKLSNNVTCPDWRLPNECKLVTTDTSCCPMPDCPTGYVLTAKSPLES